MTTATIARPLPWADRAPSTVGAPPAFGTSAPARPATVGTTVRGVALAAVALLVGLAVGTVVLLLSAAAYPYDRSLRRRR